MKFNWKLHISAAVMGIALPLVMFSNQIPFPVEKSADQVVIEEQIDDETTKDLISVLAPDGKVRNMEMNEYLTCVVLCEMPASFEMEALKAQSVVARTYALRRQKAQDKHEIADVCMDPGCCQGYQTVSEYIDNGGSEASVERIQFAVDATDGQVLLYNGTLIEATYFSCSGGFTENAAAVWGSDIPYLQATESPGEEAAAHYIDTVQLSTSEFANRLNRTLTGNPGTWIESVSYTEGGGVDIMCICGVDYKGTVLRQLLDLRSTAFVLSIVGETVTITTRGYGHRVGMSQYGADAMAIQGSTYDEILQHYYKGTQLTVYN